MEKQSIVREKSFEFAKGILEIYLQLKKQGEAEIAHNLLWMSTSIGINVEEGIATGSRKNKAEKLTMALEDARETMFWLRLIGSNTHFKLDTKRQIKECEEIILLIKKILKPSPIVRIVNQEKIKDN